MDTYFIPPPILDDLGNSMPGQGYRPYSERNYTKASPVESYIKTRHFETALRMTKEYFHRCNVIDFGCADGPFLPSLSKYFDHVAAIDFEPDQIELSRRLCKQAEISNVELICAASNQIARIKERLGSQKFTILFLLETLEHIGDKEDMYGSKVNFLKEASGLLQDDGFIVISVPVMVGLPFLLQRAGLWALRKYREPLSISGLLKAALFNDTKKLQNSWKPGSVHLGFNHRYLEDEFRREFEVLSCRSFHGCARTGQGGQKKIFSVEKMDFFFQIMYILRRL